MFILLFPCHDIKEEENWLKLTVIQTKLICALLKCVCACNLIDVSCFTHDAHPHKTNLRMRI